MNRLEQELALVQKRFAKATLGSSEEYVLIPDFPVPSGWNQPSTRLLVLIPPGYPQVPPDCFYADDTLRLASGALAGNSETGRPQAGQAWLWFSYHLEAADWKPTADPATGSNLQTFLLGIERRLEEAS